MGKAKVSILNQLLMVSGSTIASDHKTTFSFCAYNGKPAHQLTVFPENLQRIYKGKFTKKLKMYFGRKM